MTRTVIQLRLPEAEKALWQAAADKAGCTLSEWIRAAASAALDVVTPEHIKPAKPKPAPQTRRADALDPGPVSRYFSSR